MVKGAVRKPVQGTVLWVPLDVWASLQTTGRRDKWHRPPCLEFSPNQIVSQLSSHFALKCFLPTQKKQVARAAKIYILQGLSARASGLSGHLLHAEAEFTSHTADVGTLPMLMNCEFSCWTTLQTVLWLWSMSVMIKPTSSTCGCNYSGLSIHLCLHFQALSNKSDMQCQSFQIYPNFPVIIMTWTLTWVAYKSLKSVIMLY